MTFIGDETIKCVRCGNLFTWSYGEQRFYHERGLHRPKHCQDCRPIRREAFQEWQRHSPPTPLPDLPTPSAPSQQPPVPQPKPTPPPVKRPSWWANPANRLLVVFWFLIVLAVLVFLSWLVMWI